MIYGTSGLRQFQTDHGQFKGLTDDDHTSYLKPTTGTGRPTSTPSRIGQLYIDTTNGLRWISVGASSSADWKTMSAVGWLPFAYPYGYYADSNPGASANILTSRGIASAIFLPAPMQLQSMTIRILATTQHSWSWALYVQDSNSGDSGENTLRRVAASNGTDTFTSAVTVDRTLDASSAPVLLDPGTYWAVVRNDHGSNNLPVGYTTTSVSAIDIGQISSGSITLGSTIDLVTNWSHLNDFMLFYLSGRVFGQTSGWV